MSAGQGRYSILLQVDAGNAITTINQVKTQLGSLGASFTGSSGAINQTTATLDRFSSAGQRVVTTNQSLTSNLGALRNNFSGASGSVDRLSGSLTNMNNRFGAVSGGLSKTNTLANQSAGSMSQLATETEKASKSTIGMASNLRGMIVPIVGMGSAIFEAVGMFQAFQDVSKGVEDMQKRVNEAVKKYGKDSKEARDATQQLERAQRGLQFVLRNTIQSISDIGIFAALMANSFIKMRSSATALTPALNAATASNTALGGSMVATGAATNATGGILTRFTGILRAIPAALGPIGIILTAVGAAVAAFTALYSQNIGGIRDSTNNFGAAVGELIPILRPFGDLLMGIGGQLGITGESAERTAQHMRNATTGFQEMGSLWQQTLDNISQGFMEWGSNVQKGFDLVVTSFQGFFSQIGNQLGQWLGEFGASLQRGFDNVFGPLLGQATDFAQGIATELSNFGQWLTESTVNILESIGIDGPALVSQAESIAAQIASALSGAVQQLGEMATAPLKATQQPGAGGNVPRAEQSIQPEPFMGQPGALEFQKQQTRNRKLEEQFKFLHTPGLLTGGKPVQPQRVEDLGIATENIFRQPSTGLSELSSPQTLTGVRNLSAEINKLALAEQKQAAIDKIVTDQLKDQQTATNQANTAWQMLTTNHGINTVATLDMKDASELLNEEIDVGDGALQRLQDAQKAVVEGKQKGKDATEIEADVQRALNGEMQQGAKTAEEVKTVMGELRKETGALSTTLKQTGQAAIDGSMAFELQKQGTDEAKLAVLEYGQELVKNTAFNQQWGQIIETNAFKAVAFQTGVQNQVAALQQAKVEVLENAGALAEYAAQIQSGEALQIAFARGVQTQQKALLDSKVALSEAEGQLQTYAQQLASGEQQAVAFAEGQQAVQQSFLDMIRNVSELQGSISEYDRLLADGTAQTIAFAQGMEQGHLAAREFQVEIAGANGEYQGFREGLIATNPELQRFGDLSSFTNEQVAAMAAAIGGGREAIHALVEGLREAASGFTEFLGSVDIKDLDEEFDDAVDDIQKGIERMIDVAENEGVKVPQALENSLNFEATKQKAGQQLEELWPMITGILEAGANTLDPNIMSSAIDVAIANVKHVFEEADLPAATQQVVQGIITELENLKNIKDPVELQQALANIGIKIKALADNKDGLEETTTALTGLANVPADSLASLAERIAGVADSVETLIQKQPQLAGFAKDLEGLALNAPGTFEGIGKDTTPTTVGTPPPEFGTQPIADAALTDIETRLAALPGLATTAATGMSAAFAAIDLSGFATKIEPIHTVLTTLGPATQLAVLQMRAAFDGIDFTGFTEKLRVGLEPLSLLGPATQQAVQQMQDAFNSIDFSGFTAALSTALAPLALIGPATQEAVNQMVAAFVAGTNQMIGAMVGVDSIVKQVAAIIPTIGTASTNAAGVVIGATNQMIGALVGVQNQAQTTAGSFAQIGTAAQSASDVVVNATNEMIGALEGVIQQANAVAESITGIGSAAQQAASDVNSLSSAIENIPDGDAVIRVTYDVAPAPSGITAAGVGLGFSRSGTVTYTASGGSGGGGGTGGGGGVPTGGGGPGEPGLIFGAQGGLGRADQHTVDEFNKLGILAPRLIDHPMKMLVGENGPELVSVTPVNRNRTSKTGELSPFVDKRSSSPIAQLQGGDQPSSDHGLLDLQFESYTVVQLV